MKEAAVILLVEDDAAHAMLITRSLRDAESANKIIYVVSDGEEALDYLHSRNECTEKEKSPRPDLILLDMRLPKLDGHEVLKAIKESDRLRTIPVVVLITSQNEADIDRAYNNYANSYLVKPADFGKFRDMVNELTSYWLTTNIRARRPRPKVTGQNPE